jgi:hypothetical protein
LEHVSHPIFHSGGHLKTALVHYCLRQHLVDGIIEIFFLVGLYPTLDLDLFNDVVYSVLERITMHLELVLQHKSVHHFIIPIFGVDI